MVEFLEFTIGEDGLWAIWTRSSLEWNSEEMGLRVLSTLGSHEFALSLHKHPLARAPLPWEQLR